ncbi:MAG TPA: M3 family peptidase, partial [Flavobacteriales bacterium]|nr:M3 family peptidase [Flavobacteriales bacterium]
MKHNPLISDFNTYLDTAPFSNIEPKHFKPAVKQLIAEAKQDIQNITDNNNEASFENTIEALEYSGLQLSVVQNILMNINSAETNDEWQKTTEEVLPLLNDFYNDIRQNKPLFERIAKVKETSNPEDLTPEQQMLLDKTYKSFVRNGANLDERKQEEL